MGPLGPAPLLTADNIESAGFRNVVEDVHVSLVIRSCCEGQEGTARRDRGLTCERMAAAAPAVIPLPRSIPNFFIPPKFAFSSSVMPLRASSWQNSLTVNYAGCRDSGSRTSTIREKTSGGIRRICLTHLSDGVWDLFADEGQEPSVEPCEPFFRAELGEPRG